MYTKKDIVILILLKKKTPPPIYCLQILQGQLCGTHLPNFYFETVEGIVFFYLCRNNFPNFSS